MDLDQDFLIFKAYLEEDPLPSWLEFNRSNLQFKSKNKLTAEHRGLYKIWLKAADIYNAETILKFSFKVLNQPTKVNIAKN